MTVETTGDPERGASGTRRGRHGTTLTDVLEKALVFEETARDFYRAVSPRVSQRIRWLIEGLAEEEQGHYELFNDLLDRDDLQAQIAAPIDPPPTDTRFTAALQVPDLGDPPRDLAVLQYAVEREHAAMAQYRALAETAPPGPIRDLFRYLGAEEALHKAELEKIHHEIRRGD